MGMAIGAVLGLIGAGGAVVAVPAFIYLFGFAPLEATTASLAVVAVSAATGAIPRIRLNQVRMRQALLFWGLGIVGTFAGSRLATVIPEVVVIAGFAVVMLGAAFAMWRKSSAVEPTEAAHTARWLLPVVAVAIGLLTGIFGVGGGFLIVPALVLVFGFPFAIATGTSLVVVALNSVTALAFKYDTWGQIPWHIPLLVILGGLIGSVVASTLNHGISQRLLERAFAVLLVVLAAWMAVSTFVLSA
ncbi:MAG: sulfite exporter TauE/SafE family protein [Actinobacteria bacterium]|nr:sulfite exporter TauE/SafE family protein [Actinomycetota bacterium]